MELRTEVEIDAPASVVWSALLDTSRYQEWNPFITAVEGELRVGERPSITLSLPESGDMRIRPRVLVVEPHRELRWRGELLFAFLFSGEHFFRLEETSAGRTRLVHGEDFDGWLVRFLGKKLAETARSFVFMNHALKRRVERDAG
jgi:hypothetical protein